MTSVPVLLITFNRPEYTRKVLESILAAKPEDLYVFQDGAREGNEDDKRKCAEVKNVVEETTSGSEVRLHTFCSDKNMGCGRGPMTAISWFFDNVEQGVIFEDDCLPNPSFFPYCEELLDKYKDDERVGFIGGCNYGYKTGTNESYVFGSGHHQTWGWATWRRTWKLFDYYLKDLDSDSFRHIIKNYYKSIRQREYWMEIFGAVKTNRLDDSCWDYQFYFSVWKEGMLAVCPMVNLVENIGSGVDATHTNNDSRGLLYQTTGNIMPLNHPKNVKKDKEIDNYMMKSFIIPYEYGMSGIKRWQYRWNKRIKHLLGHEGPWRKKQS